MNHSELPRMPSLEDAYAEGRKDEAEEWKSVLSAARKAVCALAHVIESTSDGEANYGAAYRALDESLAKAAGSEREAEVAEAMREVGRRIGH